MVGTQRIGEAIMIKWNPGESGAPKDRRLLLIATPKGIPEELEPDIFVGHWSGNDEFVPIEPQYPRLPKRPDLKVLWWAEIPDLPEGVDLRALTLQDLKG
jgi:hypothetical protein